MVAVRVLHTKWLLIYENWLQHSIAQTIYKNFTSNGGRPIENNTRTGHRKEGGCKRRFNQLP